MALFLDTNVPLYAAGAEHPLKGPCAEIVELAARYPATFVTDAEVLQEILHRSIAIGRREGVSGLLGRFSLTMSGRIEPIYGADVLAAASQASDYPRLSARDLLHLAVMRRLGVSAMVSADQGFDGVDGVRRLDPAAVEVWAAAERLA